MEKILYRAVDGSLYNGNRQKEAHSYRKLVNRWIKEKLRSAA